MKKLYCNGTILTLESPLYHEAVLTEDGTILQVGTRADLEIYAPDATIVDLQGATLMPAFLDAHGHFSSYANAQLQVPLEECADFSEIARRITAFMAENNLPSGAWIVAKGYDHNTLAEHRHPDRQLLDTIAPCNPLVLQHQSGHCGVLNSAALAQLNITAETPDPAGGIIGRENGELTGYLEEDAYIGAIKRVPMESLDAMLGAYRKAQEKYLARGITTVQEGMMVAQMLPLYTALLASGLLVLDVVGFSEMPSMAALKKALPQSYKQYHHHFKIGGYKIFLDGSPQVKTAWMRTPYVDGSFGYGTMTDEAVLNAVRTAAEEDIQILAHCNGDAAAAQYLNAVGQVAAENPHMKDLKPVMIHAQLLGRDQLAQVATLGMIPSFFVAHILHWGDIHEKNFGFDRAQFISPARSALDAGVTFTFHQDAPVIEPNMLETVSCAVNRRTKSGVLLGETERISPLEALRAVTINAAYQYGEEGSKGSIKPGKNADFVILSGNPLTVPPEEIGEINLLETIKNGNSVYRRA
ncbi:MAG: amidohydrolase [Oscillospiraceae bacterium]